MTAEKTYHALPGTTTSPGAARTSGLHGTLAPWLRRNLTLAKITVVVLWLPAIANIAFAVMLRLADNGIDYSECKLYFIDDSPPDWDTDTWGVSDPEPWNARCRLLSQCGGILIAAITFTMFRSLVQAIPVYKPSFWTIQYSSNGQFARITSPTRIYTLQTIFSIIPAAFYLACAIILGTSRAITGTPPISDWYRPQLMACLVLVCISLVASVHQAMSTGLAGWYLRRGRGG